MKVFLSYAEEDSETASLIAESLAKNGIEVYNWLDPKARGQRFIEQIQRDILRADSFVALVSPSFLKSLWCKREVELAIQHEVSLQSANPDAAFIHVLEIRGTPKSDAGFIGGYDWLDATSREKLGKEIRELGHRLKRRDREGSAGSPGTAHQHDAPESRQGSSLFRNREDELYEVIRGLTTGGGSHFWLVVAPPQLGKTWFLRRVRADQALAGRIPWVTRLVDLRAEPAKVRHDTGALLARLFERAAPGNTEHDTVRTIAQEILRTGRPHLCLLDSAELLDEETAGTLRRCLTRIYHLVQDAGFADVRFAVIVASRRDDYWKGVTPNPRLSPLPLTEFKPEVVQQALHDLAREMKRNFSPAEVRKNSLLAHRLTEGLPALLVRCLDWIQAEEWLGMERLASQALFEELTDPYIQEGLLTQASLFPGGSWEPDEPLQVLEHAYRILAPYRLFTQSHLRHYLERDPDFSRALETVGWSMADLWKAISGTALLSRPLNEPWQEIHSAIRRLLYRYFCRTGEQRGEAHNEARKFVEIWADRQVGTEQVVGLVECLWHEANVLRLREPAEMEPGLSESARKLSRALRPSSAYTVEELREYALQRMKNDEELQEAVGSVPGLFNRLVDIIVRP